MKKIILLILMSLVVTRSFASEILLDDFNDNVIDQTKWNTAGNTVTEAGGIMQILTAATDAGGKITSQPFSINPNGLIIFKRRVLFHYGSQYFMAHFRVMNGTSTIFQIFYANMAYNNPPQHSCYGIYIGGKDGNPHDVSHLADVSPSITALWNTWYNEKITYNPTTGDVEYFINDVSSLTYNVGVFPQVSPYSLTAYYDAWGWYTGHYLNMDNLLITQGPPSLVVPEVTNVRARQLPGEHRVELTYDLANAGGGACAVQVRVSTDSGANYGEPLAAAAIDGPAAYGAGVLPGTGKRLEIKLAEAGLGNRFSREVRFQVQANDSAGASK
jgi:hypothetical protein